MDDVDSSKTSLPGSMLAQQLGILRADDDLAAQAELDAIKCQARGISCFARMEKVCKVPFFQNFLVG